MIKIAPVDRIHRDLYDKLLPRYKEIYSAEAGGFREGKYSKLAEKAICDITGRKYALLTTSGTSSIMIGCIALGLKPHDEVIVINMSAAGTVQPIKVMGAICAKNGKFFKILHPKYFKSEATIEMVKKILKFHDNDATKICFFWDNASIHTCPQVTQMIE